MNIPVSQEISFGSNNEVANSHSAKFEYLSLERTKIIGFLKIEHKFHRLVLTTRDLCRQTKNTEHGLAQTRCLLK